MSARIQAIFWIVAIVVLFFLLWLLSNILLPFVAGMAIAYFLDPLADRLERLGFSRAAATSIILGLFIMCVTVLAVIVVPLIISQANNFFVALPQLFDQLRDLVMPHIRRVLSISGATSPAQVNQAITGSAEKAVGWAAGLLTSLLGGGLAVLNVLSLLFITPIVAFYLLRDWDYMVEVIDSWLPRQYVEIIRGQAREIDQTLAGFVRGQGTVCLIMGAYYAITLSLVGLDFGLVIGVISGLITFIPYVGAFLGFGLSLMVAVLQFWPDYIWIGATAAVFGLGQFLEGNLIVPKFVGDQVGLHPVWLMFALLAFGALFGFVGLLIAVPVAAMIGVLTRFALQRYLKSDLFLGTPRF